MRYIVASLVSGMLTEATDDNTAIPGQLVWLVIDTQMDLNSTEGSVICRCNFRARAEKTASALNLQGT